MGINGNISTMSLIEVFQWLQTGQKTGTLQIESPDAVRKEVYFRNGFIISASSNDIRESIGQFLLFTKRITEQQLTEALQNQKRDHVLLGKILVQKGFLSRGDLLKLLRTISEEIIYDLFLWKEGKFEFIDDSLPKREMPSLQLDITQIVLEGATREDEWGRILNVFPQDSTILKPNIEKIAETLPLEKSDARLLALINGARSIHELSRLFKSTKYQLHKALLDLYDAELITVGDYIDQLIHLQPTNRKDAIREMLNHIEHLMSSGRLNDAEIAVVKLEKMAAQNPEVLRLKEQIKEKRLETTAKQMINPDAIPNLKMEVDKLTKMDLSPEQGFIVSRINGVWDVKSIVKISPFGETVCLKILKKFIDDGVITLK